ncbi:MAG TPA: NAD(P)/FAD-dependent oxidoreductase [Methanocorpusculum sp.]|nr:NAD(P)/FAD-dependent oxidoreductase [Methanocorpusculum sp.]HJK01103.1 NAD(P)/FAD-dependent oxidoreductase [Methanocorpusculum sp.]
MGGRMREMDYDVLVVGGGPGGALAAKAVAEADLSVLLVEKRPAIGAPVRCAEGIGKRALAEFIDVNPKWVSTDIERAVIVGPDGHRFIIDGDVAGGKVGYVLDRKMFDRELVWRAAEAGAEIQVHARASAPLMSNGRVQGAVIHQHGKTYDIHAKVVIAADGVESKFAKWAGIDTTVPLWELETCAQYLVNDIDIDPKANMFYISYEACPWGYIWVFPKGPRCANIGIGIAGSKSGEGHRAKNYLDRFMEKEFPHAKITELMVGGVSVCKPLECTVAENLLIVGDAARLSDPITGGGIYNAMYTGDLAGKVAGTAIKNGDTSKKALMIYDKTWREGPVGMALSRNYAVKESFIKMNDQKLNSIVHSMSDLQLDELSVKKLVLAIFKKNPWLALELPHLLKVL